MKNFTPFCSYYLALGVILSLFQSFETEQDKEFRQLAPFSIDFMKAKLHIELVRDTELVPGDQVLVF